MRTLLSHAGSTVLLAAAMLSGANLGAQLPSSPASQAPLPEVAALLHSVEQNQAELDRAREDYTFRQQQVLILYDKHGKQHSREQKVSDIFFVHGHAIETLISKDGKPLSPDTLKKEQERAAKEAVKYAAEPYGKPEKDDVSVARLLAITRFSNPRRVTENGRSLIAVDFTGDPHAKTHGLGEDAVKRVHGTVWVDEAAREVARLQASFDQPLHLGFGILATLDRGSNFTFEQALIRNEVWLPTAVHGRFDGKAALFLGFHAELTQHFDEYQKFTATTTEKTTPPPTAQ
jgi:hypothetical protein